MFKFYNEIILYDFHFYIFSAQESKAKKALLKAKILRKLSSQDLSVGLQKKDRQKNKENLSEEQAAVVIQSRKSFYILKLL